MLSARTVRTRRNIGVFCGSDYYQYARQDTHFGDTDYYRSAAAVAISASQAARADGNDYLMLSARTVRTRRNIGVFGGSDYYRYARQDTHFGGTDYYRFPINH